MKRWGFGGGNASHGNSISHRSAGSTGSCQVIYLGISCCNKLTDFMLQKRIQVEFSKEKEWLVEWVMTV